MKKMKMIDLTEVQEGALHLIREPGYNADGTTINDNTGYALRRRGLARWDNQAWRITDKGREYVENNL